MILEITAFFINMFILSLNLSLSMLPSPNLKQSIFKRKVTRNIKVLDYITTYKIKANYKEYRIIDEKIDEKIEFECEEI